MSWISSLTICYGKYVYRVWTLKMYNIISRLFSRITTKIKIKLIYMRTIFPELLYDNHTVFEFNTRLFLINLHTQLFEEDNMLYVYYGFFYSLLYPTLFAWWMFSQSYNLYFFFYPFFFLFCFFFVFRIQFSLRWTSHDENSTVIKCAFILLLVLDGQIFWSLKLKTSFH